jgi:hypothetical protein
LDQLSHIVEIVPYNIAADMIPVWSAYHLLLNQQNSAEGSTSGGVSSSRHLWAVIWSSQLQPKIRLFMWRACLDILPTRTKLFDKGVLNSFSCQWCGDESETTSHVLWQCEFAQRIWNACPVPIPNECVGAMNFHDFISLCITALSHPNIEILFTTAWEIWNARNRQLWDNKSPVVDDIWQSCGCGNRFF